MGFWRNPEIQHSLFLFLAVSLTAVIGGLFISTSTGIYVFLLCLVMMIIHFTVTYRRYQKIAFLTSEIDKILHHSGDSAIQVNAEGELSLLQNEIQKMTIRLREQSYLLTKERNQLADSLADISHQLRTPLTSIHLLLTMLSEPGLTEQRKRQLLRELYQLLSRIDWLVTSLLKISKLDAGTVQFRKDEIPLSDLLRTACEPLRIPAELHQQALTIEADGNLICDTNWTAEAISNIVKNCMEHTSEGGSITLHAEENPLYSEILITDTGSGIDKEDFPHIFERFYKGKNASENSFGIGLALARTIIASQNGTVKAENLPEHGAKFIIRFYKGAV